jgi:hypothetical protein
MSRPALVIRPTAVFLKPYRVLAGNIMISPSVVPLGEEVCFYFPDGRTKKIVLDTHITTSPEAMAQNLHGFGYSGDFIEESDLEGEVLVSNLPYDEALDIYRRFKVTEMTKGRQN